MWVYQNNEWGETNDSLPTDFYNFVQILQTWKGEQDFNADNGVDWFNVLNGSVDIRMEINNIALLFSNIFNVEITDYVKASTSISLTLQVSFYELLQAKDIIINVEGNDINVIY